MSKRLLLPLVILLASIVARAAEREARVIVLADQRAAHPVPRFLTGKFAEHLGSNIYNGMCAQIVRNPTFADWPFAGGGQTPDGRPRFLSDEKQIGDAIRHGASRLNWPEGEVQKLLESRADGLAHWWIREGARNMVRLSPDVGPDGERAQRVEVDRAGDGIAQWMDLPLHRVRKFEYELVLRSPDIPTFTISLDPGGASIKSFAKLAIKGTTGEWQTFRGELELPATAGADSLCRLALVADAPGQFIVSRLLLWPADRVGSADADVVRLLKESRLPLLRWPGGNFVSGYRWEAGVGPMLGRPAHPNWGWGGVETNLFGTWRSPSFSCSRTSPRRRLARFACTQAEAVYDVLLYHAAEIWQLTAAVPWATNTLDHPDTVTPTTAKLELSGNTLAVTLKPYTVMQIRVPRP